MFCLAVLLFVLRVGIVVLEFAHPTFGVGGGLFFSLGRFSVWIVVGRSGFFAPGHVGCVG
jgi:hypothetical protein